MPENGGEFTTIVQQTGSPTEVSGTSGMLFVPGKIDRWTEKGGEELRGALLVAACVIAMGGMGALVGSMDFSKPVRNEYSSRPLFPVVTPVPMNVVVPTQSLTPAVLPKDNASHKVKTGDTLFGICRSEGGCSEISELKECAESAVYEEGNQPVDPYRMKVGSTVRVKTCKGKGEDDNKTPESPTKTKEPTPTEEMVVYTPDPSPTVDGGEGGDGGDGDGGGDGDPGLTPTPNEGEGDPPESPRFGLFGGVCVGAGVLLYSVAAAITAISRRGGDGGSTAAKGIVEILLLPRTVIRGIIKSLRKNFTKKFVSVLPKERSRWSDRHWDKVDDTDGKTWLNPWDQIKE